MISSQSEGLGKMALGIVKIYLGSPFSANRRYSRSVCLRSVGSRSVCRGQFVAVSCGGPNYNHAIYSNGIVPPSLKYNLLWPLIHYEW